MQIIQTPIDKLIPYVNNARTHSDEQVAQIAASIKEFGFNNPVLVDKQKGIIAGHGRLLAAKKLGLDTVPTIELSHLSDAQRKAYILADNRLALNAGWDVGLLKIELDDLLANNIDLQLLGFGDDELAAILNPAVENEGLCDPDDVPALAAEVISKPGDLWLLGEHRLICGDSTQSHIVEKLISNNKINMVFTDPPYGINEETDRDFASRTRKYKGNKFAKIIGDQSIQTAIDSYNLCAALNIKTMIFWGANYYCHALPQTGNWLVWDKREEEKERDANSDCELAWVKSKANSVRIFRHKWKGMIKASEQGQARVHPIQKPIVLAEWCFDEYAKDSITIMDLFGGSGSTLIACEKTKRKCFMIEIDPHYCDIIIKRWQKFTGKDARLESTNKTFNEIAHGEEKETSRRKTKMDAA